MNTEIDSIAASVKARRASLTTTSSASVGTAPQASASTPTELHPNVTVGRSKNASMMSPFNEKKEYTFEDEDVAQLEVSAPIRIIQRTTPRQTPTVATKTEPTAPVYNEDQLQRAIAEAVSRVLSAVPPPQPLPYTLPSIPPTTEEDSDHLTEPTSAARIPRRPFSAVSSSSSTASSFSAYVPPAEQQSPRSSRVRSKLDVPQLTDAILNDRTGVSFNNWLASAERAILAGTGYNPNSSTLSIDTQRDLVNVTTARFEGRAATWCTVMSADDAIPMTWKEFKSTLRETFLPRSGDIQMYQTIKDASQKQGEATAMYLGRFASLMMNVPASLQNCDIFKLILIDGLSYPRLRSDVKTELYTRGSNAFSMPQLNAFIIARDAALNAINNTTAQQQRPLNRRSQPAQTSYNGQRPAPAANNWQRPHPASSNGQKPQPASNNGQKPQPAPSAGSRPNPIRVNNVEGEAKADDADEDEGVMPLLLNALTAEEREHLIRTNGCFRCRKEYADHIAINCPGPNRSKN